MKVYCVSLESPGSTGAEWRYSASARRNFLQINTTEEEEMILFTVEVSDFSSPPEITSYVNAAARERRGLTDALGKHIIVTGNPVEGFAFFGPFADDEAARFFGEGLLEVWWVAELGSDHHKKGPKQ